MTLKPLYWVGSSWKDLKGLPAEVQHGFGYALFLAQAGDRHPDAKTLKGFGGGSVVEVVEHFDKGTYRAVYTSKFEGVVYVVHAFQKKSKHGRSTPQEDIRLVKERLKTAQAHYEALKGTES